MFRKGNFALRDSFTDFAGLATRALLFPQAQRLPNTPRVALTVDVAKSRLESEALPS